MDDLVTRLRAMPDPFGHGRTIHKEAADRIEAIEDLEQRVARLEAWMRRVRADWRPDEMPKPMPAYVAGCNPLPEDVRKIVEAFQAPTLTEAQKAMVTPQVPSRSTLYGITPTLDERLNARARQDAIAAALRGVTVEAVRAAHIEHHEMARADVEHEQACITRAVMLGLMSEKIGDALHEAVRDGRKAADLMAETGDPTPEHARLIRVLTEDPYAD